MICSTGGCGRKADSTLQIGNVLWLACAACRAGAIKMAGKALGFVPLPRRKR